MARSMHPVQKQLLELGQTHNLNELGLREIGRLIGQPNPQNVKYHLGKLNLLENHSTQRESNRGNIISIPLYGLANCGEATIHADQEEESSLQVSTRLLPHRNDYKSLFAVQAVGDSMNKADIGGKSIQDGDFVIVDPDDKNFKNGDYVLSILNGLANIKKFLKDEASRQIILNSESTRNYPPIYIHEDDFDHYVVNGKVIDVLGHPENENDLVYQEDKF